MVEREQNARGSMQNRRNGSCGCGNNRPEQETRSPLLCRLQELEFALIETGLYLDMYPCERRAIRYFRRLREERERVLAEYERQNGPMTLYGAGENEDLWDWTERAWPWEYEGNHTCGDRNGRDSDRTRSTCGCNRGRNR